MADKSLQGLSQAILQIQKEKIQPDVEAIRKTLCGGDIQLLLTNINNNIERSIKKGQLLNLKNRNSTGHNDRYNRKLIKSTDTIVSLLSKINARVQKIGGGKGGKLNLREDKLKDRKLDTMAKSIGIIEQLRGIRLKDFIFAKIKMKHISNMMIKFKDMFKSFKNKKEMEATVEFANSSIEIVKKLSKVALFAIPAKLGLKAIEKLFLGGKRKGGGLLAVFREVSDNQMAIKKGKRGIKDILVATGSMFLTTILLTGIAVLAVPAMLGALAMKGIVWIMSGTFRMLNKAKKNALIGSLVLLIMSASVITFALGLGFMVKAVKGMAWKDFGMMMASIGAISAVLAIIGIPAVAALVGLGSLALLAMGAGLSIFGIGLAKTMDAVKGIEWNTFGKMVGQIFAAGASIAGLGVLSIPIAFGTGVLKKMGRSLKLFATALKEWKNLGNIKDALANIKNAVSETRKVMRGKFNMKVVKQIGKVGESLMNLYEGVKNWDKFNGAKAAANIGVTITKLQEVFTTKLDKKTVKSYGRVGRILKRLFKGVKLWENFNSVPAVKNIDIAVQSLLKTFADNKLDKKVVKSFNSVGRILRRLYKGVKPWENFDSKAAVSNISTTVSTLLSSFTKGNKINERSVESFNIVGKILRRLFRGVKLWEDLDSKTAVFNISTSVDSLLTTFAKGNKIDSGVLKSFRITGRTLKRLYGGLKHWVDFAGGKAARHVEAAVTTLMRTFNNPFDVSGVKKKIKTLVETTELSSDIINHLKVWETYTPGPALENIGTSITSLLKIFGMNDEEEKETTSIEDAVEGRFGRIKTAFKKVTNGIANTVKLVANNTRNLIRNNGARRTISTLNDIMKSLSDVRSYLEPWENKGVVTGVNNLTNTVNAINKLDMSKASMMTNLFKSFSRIGTRPFDNFTSAVHKFSDSCNDLIEALDNFEPISNNTVTTNENGETTVSSGSISINNSQDLAKAIAEAIKALPINVQTDISDVKLVVNNETGRRVILTLDN